MTASPAQLPETSSVLFFQGKGGATLRLSAANGAVLSLTGSGGAERVAPAREAFTLQLLDGAGEPTRLASSAFSFTHMGIRLEWRHANGLRVRMEIAADPGGGFCFTPCVEGIPAGMLLEWFDGPQVCIAEDRALYWPYWDGCEVTDFTRRGKGAFFAYKPLGYTPRNTGMGSLYPEFCQMQFLAAYGEGRGVYFSAVDPRHTPKGVEWERVGDNCVRLSLQTFCGDLDADGAWRPAFHYLLRPYAGGWMEACEIYRDWVRTLPGFDHQPERPAWEFDSPVNVIYPVQGEGMDHGEMKPNGYFPFTNAMPTLEKYGRLFNSKIMALLMHWEGTAPWAPPYVWPPLGGEDGLATLRDALHARGDLLGVYCSGTAWTQVSCIDVGYTQEQKCEDEGLGRHMIRGPKGEIAASICNHPMGQRLGYDMCLTEEWTARTLDDELRKIARFGIDYCQFFDQNIGGGWLSCYARHHRHPPVPGAWATDAMLALQRRLLDTIRECGAEMTLGCEGAAATPYVPNLFYNDSRAGITIYFGKPVPGNSFVFHEWMCNFSGNMCYARHCDPFYRWMRAFHYGEMMSVILGADGRLASAWGVPWDEDELDQDALVALVRRLNDLRKRYPSFLLEGRMIRPFLKCESHSARITHKDAWYDLSIDTHEILVSFWENAKGERIGFASNWRREPSDLVITHLDSRVETRTLAPLETIVVDTAACEAADIRRDALYSIPATGGDLAGNPCA